MSNDEILQTEGAESRGGDSAGTEYSLMNFRHDQNF